MTKQVRIENADTSNHKLGVEVWVTGTNGMPDYMEKLIPLNNPTDMATVTIWEGKYLVIKEYK